MSGLSQSVQRPAFPLLEPSAQSRPRRHKEGNPRAIRQHAGLLHPLTVKHTLFRRQFEIVNLFVSGWNDCEQPQAPLSKPLH